MDKFDEAVDQYLEPIDEGIMSRLGQRVKNIGRTVKHPFAKLGSGDEALAAISTTGKGYKKLKVLNDILDGAVKDLQKLGVIHSELNTDDVSSWIGHSLEAEGYLTTSEEDLSFFGKKAKDDELKAEKEAEYRREVEREEEERRRRKEDDKEWLRKERLKVQNAPPK